MEYVIDVRFRAKPKMRMLARKRAEKDIMYGVYVPDEDEPYLTSLGRRMDELLLNELDLMKWASDNLNLDEIQFEKIDCETHINEAYEQWSRGEYGIQK